MNLRPWIFIVCNEGYYWYNNKYRNYSIYGYKTNIGKGYTMKTIKRISIILIIFSIIIGISSISFASTNGPKVILDVKVYIDGIEFKTDQDFYSLNGTTLVPMRAFFEKLGAEVEWIQETKTIIAKTSETLIELGIDRKIAKKDGKDIVLAVEPKLINKSTYVPLRFVAEALNFEVDWNGPNKIISIIDLKQVSEQKNLKVYESSLFFKDDYVKMEILNNREISIKGATGLDKIKWMFKVEGIERVDIWGDIKSDNTYADTLILKDEIREGDYNAGVYLKGKDDSMYWGYYWGIPFRYDNGEMFFPISPVYQNNYLKYKQNAVVDPKQYLNINISNNAEKTEIINLAKKIIIGAKSDYEKALKINEWVADNIYYNWDGYLSGNYGKTDAYGTLDTRKSVCQGYSELTNVLLRSVEIPSRLVTGYALGVSASGKGWDKVDHTKTNHAWNEAFVDNRWITIDTTWNSGNKYENGVFNKGNMKYRYFDPNLEVFSYTHKIISIR